ncbi:MAG TPA: hypothetical protein VMR62_34980 [Bryobacteraceae bacterium]|jgi:uncharacterized protein involved in exopolysaccharide biosynthesis|nr:hypothetical protein [Bryobacteraceae bacterium]
MLTGTSESVNSYRYLSFLGSRWPFLAASCAIAVLLTLGVTLTQPKLYTATCRILIEPPAGTDIRSALGVSPIYLESLKTYEHFAASDSLFVRALDKFELRRRFPARTVESLKAGILKVGMVRDTKILEIKVTLPDPKASQALAQYLAEETVKLSRSVDQEADQDLTQTIEQQEAVAQARVDRSEAAWTHTIAQQPVERLQQEIQSGGDLKSSLEHQLLGAEADAAEGQAGEPGAARARSDTLRKQLAQVDQDLAVKEALLGQRLAERDRVDAERTASQDAYTTVETRLNQVRADRGYRSERLKIIDPGIVPEQPSAPNLPLRLLAALVLGLVVPVVYLTLELSYRTQRAHATRPSAPTRTLRATGTADE